jgi:hypothetical protein
MPPTKMVNFNSWNINATIFEHLVKTLPKDEDNKDNVRINTEILVGIE